MTEKEKRKKRSDDELTSSTFEQAFSEPVDDSNDE